MAASSTRNTGRPMSKQREMDLLDAALEVLATVGYDKFTVAAVCEVAGASTKTAYRRWSNKDELLVASLKRVAQREVDNPVALIHKDTLRESLIANMADEAASYRASANFIVGLLVASRVNAEIRSVAVEMIRRQETNYCAALLREAVGRGEANPDADPEYLADLARGFFMHEVLVRDASPDHSRISTFVDRVLMPLCATDSGDGQNPS